MPFKEINVKSAIEEQRENDNDFKEAWDSSQMEYANLSSEMSCTIADSFEHSHKLVPKS